MEAAKAKAKARAKALTTTKALWATLMILLVLGPISVAVFFHRVAEVDLASLPDQGSWFSSLAVPACHDGILRFSERLGDGLLPGPEDLAYDAEAGVIYTGCRDGWIKKVSVTDEGGTKQISVENWANVGGRPLGIAIGADKQLFIADANRGLLRVTKEGEVKVLTDEAEGVRFGLPNSVNVADNGLVYFTDSSYKYNIHNFGHDAREGRPYGRLLSYNPVTNHTQVLVPHLYFANGLALSHKQDFLVFCETTLYPFVRKAVAAVERFVKLPRMSGHGGVLCVSQEGEAVALYSDPDLYSVSSAIKIGDTLYYGSLTKAHISRIDIKQHPALGM
ncbi:Strictosidine synthase [Asimina triloba]